MKRFIILIILLCWPIVIAAQGFMLLAGNNFNGADIALNFYQNTYFDRTVGSYVSLSSQVSVSRAGPETCTDHAFNITYVGNNTPCVTDIGFQSTWETRKNLILNSGDLSNASWTTFTSGTGTITVTPNAGLAPDGTMTAALITINRADVTSFAEVLQAFTGTVASYSDSIFVQAASGSAGKQIVFFLGHGSGSPANINVQLQSSWQRAQLSNATLAASANCQIGIGYINVSGNTTTGSVSFYAWGGQAELGVTVSPYIPNGATATTRPADVVSFTGDTATILASGTGSIAAWTNSSDKNAAAQTLIDSNGTVLLGKNTSNQITTSVGATLASSNAGTWLGVNNFGLAWDPSGGLLNLIGTQTADATARTPAGTFHLGSTSGTSNFWNGNVGTLLFYKTKQATPRTILPTGVAAGFVNRYAGSNLPGTAQFRDLTYLQAIAPTAPALYLQNTGTYNAEGTNSPYAANSVNVSGTLFTLTEGAISGPATRQQQWRNINLYTGSDPLTWSPNASNPAITANVGGADDNFLLHPVLTQAFAGGSGGAALTAYYSAISATGGNWNIFWATSPTGLPGSWTKQGVAIAQNPGAGYPNPGLPSMIVVGSTAYMYVATNGDAGNSIAVFTSPISGNGGTWAFAGIVLNPAVATDWDFGATFTIDPGVMKNNHGWVEMFYTASIGGTQILGYSVAASPVGPFVRASTSVQKAFHNLQTGDAVSSEDANGLRFAWDEDTGVLNGTSNPYGLTIPPYGWFNFLLKRDIDPASNDNSPMWLEKAA